MKDARTALRSRTSTPRLKGSADLREDRRKLALASLDSGSSAKNWGDVSVVCKFS
jgi:hypothetical protein